MKGPIQVLGIILRLENCKSHGIIVSGDAGKGGLAIKSKVQASLNAGVSLSDYGRRFYGKAVLFLYTTNPS